MFPPDAGGHAGASLGGVARLPPFSFYLIPNSFSDSYSSNAPFDSLVTLW